MSRTALGKFPLQAAEKDHLMVIIARLCRFYFTDVFCHRCRYFKDSGIIGSKEFVAEVFDDVKHLLDLKDSRRFTLLSGVDGVNSMKR